MYEHVLKKRHILYLVNPRLGWVELKEQSETNQGLLKTKGMHKLSFSTNLHNKEINPNFGIADEDMKLNSFCHLWPVMHLEALLG